MKKYVYICSINKKLKDRKMLKEHKRFVWLDSEKKGVFKEVSIIVDTKTGVNYIFVEHGYSGGLTALLDENGNPVVTHNIVES